jgi:hypothetical protein
MRTRRKRTPCTCCLRQPPHFPDPPAPARHHLFPKEIHKKRTRLRRGIQRIRMRERPKHRIRLRSSTARNRPPGRPRVKCRPRMSRGRKRIPGLPLPRRFPGPLADRPQTSHSLDRSDRVADFRVWLNLGLRRRRQRRTCHWGIARAGFVCRPGRPLFRGDVVRLHSGSFFHLRDGTDHEKSCDDHVRLSLHGVRLQFRPHLECPDSTARKVRKHWSLAHIPAGTARWDPRLRHLTLPYQCNFEKIFRHL